MARAAATGWSAANYLTRAGYVKNGDALLMNAWVYGPHNATAHCVSQGTAGTTNHRRTLRCPGTPRSSVESVTVGAGSVNSAAGLSTTGWAPIAAAFNSATDRTCYHTGGNEPAHNTTNLSPNAPDQIRIGISHAGTLPWFNTGSIADVSFWDTAGLSDADIDSIITKLHTLTNGSAPNPLVVNAEVGQVWSGKLLAYWPLDINAASPWADASGNGHNLSMTGTLTDFGSYPPVNAATVTAGVTGTILNADPRLETDIVAGGRTIILTLANTSWVAAGATFDAQRQNIINGLVSNISPTNGWNDAVIAALSVTNVVRTSDAVVTITLPAVAAYALGSTSDVVTVTVPATAIASGQAVVATPTITIHPIIATSRRATSGWGVDGIPNPGGDYLTGPAFVTADGFLVSLWVNQPDSPKGMPWQLGKDDILSHHWRFITAKSEYDALLIGKWWNPTGEPGDVGYDSLQDHTGGQAVTVPGTAGFPTDRWVHLCGAWMSNSEKYGWMFGDVSTEDSDTVAATPNTPTETRLGVRVDQADGLHPGDQMAEVSVWDISAMSIAEVRQLMARLGGLSNGLAPNPLTVNADSAQPWTGKLISYPDLDKTSATWKQDRSGNHAAYTEVGTLTEGSSYPPVAAYSTNSRRRFKFGARRVGLVE